MRSAATCLRGLCGLDDNIVYGFLGIVFHWFLQKIRIPSIADARQNVISPLGMPRRALTVNLYAAPDFNGYNFFISDTYDAVNLF